MTDPLRLPAPHELGNLPESVMNFEKPPHPMQGTTVMNGINLFFLALAAFVFVILIVWLAQHA